MLGVMQMALGIHERRRGRVRRVGLVVGAVKCGRGGLVALRLRVSEDVLVHVLGGARCRGTTRLNTPHYVLLILS